MLAWVHAASVGETNAVLPVIEALSAARPDLNILLTTGTVTSASLAERRLPARSLHQYVPLDAPEYAARFLDHWRPDLAIFTESEIWPSLILETSARAIPLALVNARLSHRSRRRWQRNKSMAQPLFNRFDVVLAQNERLAQGFTALGARNVQLGRQPENRCAAAAGRSRRARAPAPGARRAPGPRRRQHARRRGGDHRGGAPRARAQRRGLLHHHRPAPSRARHGRRRAHARLRAVGGAALDRRGAGQPHGHLHRRYHRRAGHALCALPRSPSSAARSSIAAGRTRSRRCAMGSPSSPARTGRTSATPTARCCATAAPSR